MIQQNELRFDGTASSSFPFKIAVIANDGINVPEDKSTLNEFNKISGAKKIPNNAKPLLHKRYEFELITTKQEHLDAFKYWLKGSGWLEPFDSPGRRWYVYKIESYQGTLTEVNSYNVSVTFICHPEAESTNEKTAVRNNNKLVFENRGTAQTYPVFEISIGAELKMIAFSHPDGKAVQIGYENGPVLFRVNDKIYLDFKNRILTINGTRKYVNSASQFFSIDPGTTEVGIMVNSGGMIPSIIAKYREGYL